jgi:uncharacterized MAPEG superfamily protein
MFKMELMFTTWNMNTSQHVMNISMFHELMFTFIIYGIFMNIQLYNYFGGTREACLPTSYICWLIILIIYRILYIITINPRT